MTVHAVLLDSAHGHYVYGPFTDQEDAEQFAQFLSAEVDPAKAVRLHSPVDELLGWWRNTRRDQTVPLAEEGTWPPRLGDTWQDRDGDRWIAVPGDQLLHLARLRGSAPYDEIWRLFGPLALVHRTQPREEEPPF